LPKDTLVNKTEGMRHLELLRQNSAALEVAALVPQHQISSHSIIPPTFSANIPSHPIEDLANDEDERENALENVMEGTHLVNAGQQLLLHQDIVHLDVVERQHQSSDDQMPAGRGILEQCFAWAIDALIGVGIAYLTEPMLYFIFKSVRHVAKACHKMHGILELMQLAATATRLDVARAVDGILNSVSRLVSKAGGKFCRMLCWSFGLLRRQ
jgi:hypothetical protein